MEEKCTKFCEQCGDCLECYAEGICPIAGVKHGEMIDNVNSQVKVFNWDTSNLPDGTYEIDSLINKEI